MSTAGSVLGAALTGFVLIALLPISKIFLGAAIILLALGALGSWLSTRALPLGQLAACAACAVLSLLPAAKSASSVYARESAYGRIVVFDSGRKRFLLVNGTAQSVMDMEGGESESQYIRGLEWTRALRPKAARGLLIGLGAGLLPKALERRGLTVDAFEIDPEIAETARAYFGYEPRGRVVIGDGRAALENEVGTWDLAFLDAFGAESPPAHLFTTEAFARVRERLAPDGVFAINLVSVVSGPDSRPWKSVYRTLSASFPNVRAFMASDPADGLANVLLFASAGPLEAGPPRSPKPASAEVALMLNRELHPSAGELSEVPVLTDDYAPLDTLMAATAGRWRRLLQQAMPEVLLN